MLLYEVISEFIKKDWQTAERTGRNEKMQFYLENGASVCYEALPSSYEHGLIETGTPECASAKEAVLYQAANESILKGTVERARLSLLTLGFCGKIHILKNCRASNGTTYGSQENYDALAFASNFQRDLFKVFVLLWYPVVLLVLAVDIISTIVFLPIVIIHLLVQFIIAELKNKEPDTETPPTFQSQTIAKSVRLVSKVIFPFYSVAMLPIVYACNKLMFKKLEKALIPFVATRIIFTGAGSIIDGKNFIISERSEDTEKINRVVLSNKKKPMLDRANLVKELFSHNVFLAFFRNPLKFKIFNPKNRFQIAFSDSNRCHHAEYLKIGVTALLIEMQEAGFLKSVPNIIDPVAEMKNISNDPELNHKVKLADGSQKTAIEIQQWYLTASKRYLEKQTSVSMETDSLVKSWEQTLNGLKNDKEGLIGRVDWITKKYFLERLKSELEPHQMKWLDLSYHDLNSDTFETIIHDLEIDPLITEEEITHAKSNAPENNKARKRSLFIKKMHYEGYTGKVSWDNEIKTGERLAKVLQLFKS